ncbi:hypothetical protein ACTGV4_11740, partial [Streptococcus suis]
KAEQALRESEQFMRTTLDALTAHIAILGEDGTILAVNKAWRDFAEANHADPSSVGVGACYFNQGASEGLGSLEGIRDVLAGRRSDFTMEYPCHT